MNKHIVLAGNTAWSMYNFRGKLIHALVKQGYRVTVIAPYDELFTPQLVALSCEFISIAINAKGTNPFQDLRLVQQYKKIFKRIRPDFIFFYTIKPNIYGSFAAQSCKIPHIAFTTGLGYTFISNSWVSKISKILYKRAFKKAHQVWFLNEDDKQTFITNCLVVSKNTFVLKGEGIDLSRFKISSMQKREPATFLLIARMLWDKGVGEFVEAARLIKQKYPATQFQLLGFLGVDNPSAISKQQMDVWQAEGVIEYLGTTEDVTPFIEKATSIVLPSYREGIPFTLLESSASGRPIITTNAVGCKEVIEDGETGFMCEVKNVQSLADCMEKIILLSQEEYVKMAVTGRRKIEQEFDVNIIINAYLVTLDTFLNKERISS